MSLQLLPVPETYIDFSKATTADRVRITFDNDAVAVLFVGYDQFGGLALIVDNTESDTAITQYIFDEMSQLNLRAAAGTRSGLVRPKLSMNDIKAMTVIAICGSLTKSGRVVLSAGNNVHVRVNIPGVHGKSYHLANARKVSQIELTSVRVPAN